MAFAYATFPALRDRNEYACVGVPPEKEITPEPPENGAVRAAIARVLRAALSTARGPVRGGLKPEPEGG